MPNNSICDQVPPSVPRDTALKTMILKNKVWDNVLGKQVKWPSIANACLCAGKDEWNLVLSTVKA